MTTLALLPFNIGAWEALVLLALGLLIFGRRLPEVGRSLGKGIVEFRRGLSGVEKEMEEASRRAEPRELPEREVQAKAPVNDSGEDVRVGRSSTRVAADGGSGPAA